MPITNQQRAEWADAAIAAFNKVLRTDPHIVELYDTEEIVLTDLLADLMHWADSRGVNWDRVHDIASETYQEEVIEEKISRREK